MDVHLIDGTYELFRHYYAVPPTADRHGQEVGAVRGVMASVLSLLERGGTHVAVATDHVIESFRNDLYAGYKTGDGIEEPLLAQFPILEEALTAMGVTVWPMIEFEADDGLASAAAIADRDERVERVLICTPDKDLAQCVRGARIVQFDRMRNIVRTEAGVVEKFGVAPASIPDYLALVGDSADGFPGLQGWGPKSAASLLSVYGQLEQIPKDWRTWPSGVRGAQRLAAVLLERWDDAVLFRTLATLRSDVPLFENVDALKWSGPAPGFDAYCDRLQFEGFAARAWR